jgi:phage terminase large subunit-like protein
MAGAEGAIKFIEWLKHPEKSEYAGKPLKLLNWQKEWLRRLFTPGDDGRRKVRKSVLWCPKKSGKTTLLAALAVYFLFNERGGQIFVGANDRAQASILFDMAASIIEQMPWLAKRARVYRGNSRRILCKATGSELIVGSSEALTKNGLNVSVGIFDECGFFASSELWDAIESSQITRSNPLMLGISTAGSDTTTFGYQLWEQSKKWIADPAAYPDCLGIIYAGDPANWMDEAEWDRCNPSLLELGNRRFIREQIRAAQDNPQELRRILRYHFNVWTSEAADEPWISVERWDTGSGDVPEAELAAAPCWLGIDLATRSDMSAIAALWRLPGGRYHVRMRYFTPADTLDRREHTDKAPYGVWKHQGHLTAVPGDFMDSNDVREAVRELRGKYRVQAIGLDDAHNAADLSSNLQKDGAPLHWVRQGWKTICPAAREVERLIAGGLLTHAGNPVLRWNVQNVRLVEKDDAGNLYPSKRRSTGRIDGAFALMNALAVEMPTRPRGRPSLSF